MSLIKCPNCGYAIKKSNPILTVVAWLFFIGLFFSVFTNLAGIVSKKDSLEVVESGICQGKFGSRTICGVIVNNTDKQYSYVHVEINLYDASGAQISSTSDTITNLEPSGKWRFNARIWSEEVSGYKIKDISAF